uniref:Short gastrulation n=1 Tax=Anopheles dirus TaxID=7168 RepID=A0A182N420_9DIPT
MGEECQFGKTIRELHTTWFADLGPPFGVMYCIMCECVPFQKKRRVVGRVQCRNIKNECPKPTCDDPILLPGRCCKTCPGDAQSPDVVQDLPQATMPEEEERSKHFAALLTGRTSSLLKKDDMSTMYSTLNPQNVVATGRFSFHKKNLYYSFYVSERAARPRAIQFVHANGNILEEHTLALPADEGRLSAYQNGTGKVCGVWRRVPREYRRLLRDELVSVVLLWGSKHQAELAIAGPIAKYPALAHELFSALLEPAGPPEAMSGAGGTAIVSTSSGVTSSIHLTIVLNGLFTLEDVSDVPLNVRLESLDKRQLILEDVQRVRKPAHEINVLEVSSPVSVSDLRLLTRGKLTLTVESRRNPDLLRLAGPVRSRVACEVFQTLLGSHGTDARTDASGLAWMYQNRDGALVYHVQTHHLHGQPGAANPVLTLIDDSAKRKPELETMARVFSGEHAYGIIDRMGPRVLEPLYSGDLAIHVSTEQNLTLLHGKFVTRQVADARDSKAPVLLRRTADLAPLAHAVGMAWLAVDNECTLHYDLTLAGIPSAFHPLQLYLEELPLEAPNAPVSRRLLEDFGGNQLEGFQLGLPPRELARLETSVIYLEVRSNSTTEPLLRARLGAPTRVPSHCTGGLDNEVQQDPSTANDVQTAANEKCFHSGRFYNEGETWRSAVDVCTMCSCDHQQYKCEAMKCPPLRCRKEDIVQKKGECCPSCAAPKVATGNNLPAVPVTTVSTSGSSPAQRGCNLGDEYHEAGTTWHPYLHPSGYETCTICTCDLFTLQVRCARAQCPALPCSDKVAYRPDKKACCKVCPQVKEPKVPKKAHSTGVQEDEPVSASGTLRSPQTLLEAGGCRFEDNIYENGQEYHPILATHGEEKCIKCRCKDGQLNCNRKRCNRAVCNRQNVKRPGQPQHLQQQQPVDECCQCRPARHHRKRQQQQQQQQQQTNVKS